MKIRDYAAQFCVLVLATDADWGAEAKKSLTEAGYENYLITDSDDLKDRLQSKNPHVVVYCFSELMGSLNSWAEGILKFNPEIRFVTLGLNSQFAGFNELTDHGFEEFVTFEKENLGPRVSSSVDRICEKLYFIYQNEQLLNDLKKSQVADHEPAVLPALKDFSIPVGNSLTARVVAYQSASGREALIQKFFDHGGVQPIYHFRFLPSVLSFVVTQAAGVPPQEIQGVGCQIEGLAIRDLSTQLSLGVVPAPILVLAQKALKIKNPKLLPLYVASQLEGFILFSADIDEQIKENLMDEFSLFALAFSYLDLQKRLELLETQDPTTEVFNRKYYDIKLIEEVERALRIKQAVSIMKISIDDFFEIEQVLGDSAHELLLKKVAQLILKSSRTNDCVARTGQNEFTVLMPHCHRQGAMIRAERVRRIVENSMTVESGIKVSISVGISEYPTLCGSAAALEESAAKALHHIASRGGNKICLFKAPLDHAPEFEVRVEPG